MENGELDEFADTLGISCVQSASYLEVSYGGGSAYVPENSLNSDSRIFFEMDNTPGKYFRSGDAKRVCGGTVPRRYSGRIIPYNDNESYPSEIGKLLNFLQENMVELMENNQSTVQRLGVLTIQVLAVIPTSNSALEQLLEEHGWNNKELRYEYSVVGSGNSGIDYDSLSQALGTLYLAHLAQSEEQPEEGASSRIRGRTSSTIAFDDIELKAKRSLLQPDYLYYSYAPSILFKIIATMFDEDPSRDMAREADVVPFALDENGSGDEGSIFQLKPTKSFFCNKSLSFGDSDVSNPPSGSMSEHIRKSMSNAIFNANLPKPELSCRETDFMGACLLADISGFTKLSASFCKNGSIGLDKLHQATNGLLGNFVRIVYKHHGDVIAFAGDALICVFPVTESGVNSNSGMKQMCQFAVMCASELVGVHTSDLTSHIGISCGPMSMAILGGHDNKWVYLMNGACISELSSCIDDAGPGEVVVTEDVYKIISDDDINAIPGSELVVANLMKESGNYKVIHLSSNFGKYFEFSGNRYDGLNLTTNITSAVRLFVPRTVEYGISSGTFLSMSELREVTTLFLKLDTYDSVKNRSPMTLQPFFQMAQKEVANMGGFMRQFLIDDKGCVLIAMWGVPSCSHPNNAARAVACGIRIHGSIAMYHHSCSIGITTGHVFCGNIGSLVRRDFVGIGADVNLAARLMAKAKGLIFVDQRSHNLLPLQFRRNMTKSDGLVLKGVADTTFAYICDGSMDHRLLTEKTSNFFSIPKHIASIVQSEVLKVAKGGAMETGLSRSRNKMSSVIEQKITASIILVEGPSGSGKSSVTALLRRLARNEKLRVVYIEGRQRDRNVRHGIARKIFISLVGSKYFETEQQQRFILDELVTSFHKKTDKLGFKAQLQVLAVSLGLEWNDEVSEEESGPLRYFVSPLASRASSARNRNWRQPSGHLDAGVQTGKFNSASKDSYSDATVSDLVVERSDSICNTKDTLEQTIDLQEIILNKALKILLERETTVIVIDDMHFADECSWNQLRMLMDFNSSLLIAISVRQHHASQDKVNHSEKSVSSSNRPPSSPHSRLPFFNSAPNRSDTSAKYEMGIGTASGNASPTKAGGQSKLQSSPAFEALCELRNATKIEMLPLSSKESKKFISQVLQESDVLSAEVMENVMKLTSGNIYLLKETANFIMERGIDAFMDACKCSTTSPLRVFIVSRLEKLSFEQQSVLKYASLIGEEFSWSLINHMIPPQFRRNLERTLDSLINHGFIFVVVNEPLTFSFVDPTKRMILYGLTPDRWD